MLFKYRLDHAPADNPDDCVNSVLDTIGRQPNANIGEWSVSYASKYVTYLTVESSIGYPYLTDSIRCNCTEFREFTLTTLAN